MGVRAQSSEPHREGRSRPRGWTPPVELLVQPHRCWVRPEADPWGGGRGRGGVLWHKWPMKSGAAGRNQSGKQLRGGGLGGRRAAVAPAGHLPSLLPPDVASRVASWLRCGQGAQRPPPLVTGWGSQWVSESKEWVWEVSVGAFLEGTRPWAREGSGLSWWARNGCSVPPQRGGGRTPGQDVRPSG